MSNNPSCDHAIECVKCELYYCANDELIFCKSCLSKPHCSDCFNVKDVDPCLFEYFCNRKYCTNEAFKNAQQCNRCKKKCVHYKKIIIDSNREYYYLCKRCCWRLHKIKKSNSQKKSKV